MGWAWDQASLCPNVALRHCNVRKGLKGASERVEASLDKLSQDLKIPLPRLRPSQPCLKDNTLSFDLEIRG